MSRKVTLGRHEYTVVAQPHARIFRGLPRIFEEMGGLDEGADLTDATSAVNALGDRVHDVLRLFIPDLMGKPEFLGYASQQAMDADEYDEAAVNAAPTMPQIIEAFEAAIDVNGGRRLGELLGKLLGPQLAESFRRVLAARVSQSLQTSLSPNGASASTSSGERSRATPA